MTDNGLIRQKRIVIRIGQGSLSFSQVKAEGVDFVAYPVNSSISMAANLREALRTVPMLDGGAERTLVLIDTPVLMMPVDLFRQEEQEALYQHTFTRQEQQAVLSHVLPDLNSVALFSIHKDLAGVLRDAFGNVTFMPVASPVWRHLHQRSFTGQHQKLYAYCHERRMEVFSFNQNRFKFCNTYAVNNPNDALYYMLAAWKQLGLEPEHDELYLAGDLPEQEVLLGEAKKFVKRVFYINPSGEFNRAAVTQIAGMPYDLMVLFIKK